MTAEEIQGEIIWFEDLKEAILTEDYESALAVIDAYLNLLKKNAQKIHKTPVQR